MNKRHFLPVLLFAFLSMVILLMEQYVDQANHEKFIQETQIVAEQTATRIEDFFTTRLHIVRHLSIEWSEGVPFSHSKFKKEALGFQKLFSGFQAINWIDEEGVIRWVVPEASNPNTLNKSILTLPAAASVFEKAKESRQPQVTQPFRLLQGFIGVVGYFPILKENKFNGVITAVFNTHQIIRDALSKGLGPDHVIRIMAGDKLVYQSRNAGFTDLARANFKVWDKQWTLIVSNISEVGKNQITPIKLFFLMGLLLALLFSIALWFYMKRHEDLKIAMQVAESASQAKSDFLSSMSHDLRTPLNAILGFSDMMRTNTLGPLGNSKYEEYANDIYGSGKVLVSLINDVLDLSKIEAGKYELLDNRLNVSAIIKTCTHQMSPLLKEAELAFDIECSPNLHDLLGDERALVQLLNNLLSNAVKFSKQNSVIKVSAGMDENDGVLIQVADCGIGMSPEGIERALRPFEYADAMKSQEQEGTGLGLHICSNLMQLFGGELKIESVIDEGTTASLRFPPSRTIFLT